MPLKILFLSHRFYPDIGGIEVNSEILAHAFHKAGHKVHLLTWTPQSGEKQFPFPVFRTPGLGRLLKEHAWADVVFENNPSLKLSWPSIFFNRSSVVALRTWVSRIDGRIAWQDKLKLLRLGRVSAVIAVSQAVRQRCWPLATVIGNPYRTDLFKIIPATRRLGSFLFVGRLVSDKGVDLAIRAIHRLIITAPARPGSPVKPSLTIVGDGPEREKLEGLVNTLYLNDYVQFTGALSGEALVTCFNQHRYLLVPSRWEEPFGNVVLEGMACGCLPIVSDGGGLPDAVGDGGLVFKRDDLASLLACIRRLQEEPELEQQLRKAALDHLASHQADVVSQRYIEILEAASRQFKLTS